MLQVTHKHMDSLDPFNGESYTFTYGQDGTEALVRQNALMKHKVGSLIVPTSWRLVPAVWPPPWMRALG